MPGQAGHVGYFFAWQAEKPGTEQMKTLRSLVCALGQYSQFSSITCPQEHWMRIWVI